MSRSWHPVPILMNGLTREYSNKLSNKPVQDHDDAAEVAEKANPTAVEDAQVERDDG